MNRRQFVKGSVIAATALVMSPVYSFADNKDDVAMKLGALERRHGGRLGVAMLDTATGQRVAHRGDERFLVCSTFKLLLVAAVLERVDRGREQLDRRVVFDKSALLDWAPVTSLNVGSPGMSVQELCEAAMLMSDNTAANLLLETINGPAGVTTYARSLGDKMTRLDHAEPLNDNSQGDEDTTTPWAMLGDMQAILLADALSEASRKMLLDWLVLNQTGAQSLRAGLPADWRVGDKTGSAAGANNDIASIWPSSGKPVLVTAYYMAVETNSAERKAVLAEVGRIVASSVG